MNWTLYNHAIGAFRFWERGRLVYNGVLLVLTAVCVGMRWPDAHWFFHEHFRSFLIDALIANVLYCVGYFVEPLLLFPVIQPFARQARGALLVAGTVFACLLAFVDLNMVLLVEPFLD